MRATRKSAVLNRRGSAALSMSAADRREAALSLTANRACFCGSRKLVLAFGSDLDGLSKTLLAQNERFRTLPDARAHAPFS
jgi:hypothetical protein